MTGNLIFLLLILAFVGSSVIVRFRGRMGDALRIALIWGVIFLGVAAAYGVVQSFTAP